MGKSGRQSGERLRAENERLRAEIERLRPEILEGKYQMSESESQNGKQTIGQAERSAKNMPAFEATCRYQHTAGELRLVANALDVMNALSTRAANETSELSLDGCLDVFWVDTIMGRVVWDHVAAQWVYLPTTRGEKPEQENDDDH